MKRLVHSVLLLAVARTTRGLKMTLSASNGVSDVSDDTTAEIQASMKLFISALGGKRSYIVTHGDSTQHGLSAKIDEALGMQKLFSYLPCRESGQDCNLPDFPFGNTTELRAKLGDYQEVFNNLDNAFDVFRKCNGGNSGGPMWVTSHLNGSLIKYMWGYTPEINHACWNECMTSALEALKPDAVIVNQGLHLLHMHPVRACSGRGSYYNCGDYEANVETVLGSIQTVSPITLWRTTNWACDSKYSAAWKQVLQGWYDSNKSVALESQCRKECAGFSDDRPCANELIDSRGTTRQYESQMRVVAKLRAKGLRGRIGIVDAFNLTKERCEYTKDARHYLALDSKIALQMAKELVVQAAMTSAIGT